MKEDLETQSSVEIIEGEEVKVDKHGNPLIRDEHGRFPKGVAQPYGFQEGDPRINREGRPKGTDWGRVLDTVFAERKAGMSDEEFMIYMVQLTTSKNEKLAVAAMHFIEKFMRKPAKETETTVVHKFTIPDMLSAKRKNPELASGGDEED